MMSGVQVRPYRREDRQAVRDIAWDTAYIGSPADAFFSDKRLLQDFLTRYFTDHEPGSCFVAEAEGRVVGYLLGAEDERRIKAVACRTFVPGLLLRFLFRDLFSARDRQFLAAALRSGVRGEFRGECFSGPYPAVLHINIIEGYRGSGTGSRLMAAFIEQLTQRKVRGVHLATMSPRSGAFFEKQGFTLLSRHTRSYFSHIDGRLMEVMIYGKKLSGEA